MRDIQTSIDDGLEDLSISRPSERLTWGIPVPNDPSQTIYVWLDALLNYVSILGYPWQPGSDTMQSSGWPANVQIIGKDITKFHCIYWPAFLMALDLPVPRTILTHAHWTLSNRKMSKSTGNVVNPFFAINRFGVDTMRLYLAFDGGILNDSDYDNSHIITRYKTDLQNGLGNVTSRIVRAKAWDVETCITRARHRVKEKQILGGVDAAAQLERILHLRELVSGLMDNHNPRSAAKLLMDHVHNVSLR